MIFCWTLCNITVLLFLIEAKVFIRVDFQVTSVAVTLNIPQYRVDFEMTR